MWHPHQYIQKHTLIYIYIPLLMSFLFLQRAYRWLDIMSGPMVFYLSFSPFGKWLVESILMPCVWGRKKTFLTHSTCFSPHKLLFFHFFMSLCKIHMSLIYWYYYNIVGFLFCPLIILHLQLADTKVNKIYY